MLTWADKGGGGVGEMLTMADVGGRGGLDPLIFRLTLDQCVPDHPKISPDPLSVT